MGEVLLLERTRQMLEEFLPGERNTDTMIRQLLRTEYLRRLGQYRRTDMLLSEKYGVDFDEFISQRFVQQKGYSWEVESDAMDWETAISGIRTMEQRLEELREGMRG